VQAQAGLRRRGTSGWIKSLADPANHFGTVEACHECAKGREIPDNPECGESHHLEHAE
jgi:hypothetical protein